jgi:hypothetical protein
VIRRQVIIIIIVAVGVIGLFFPSIALEVYCGIDATPVPGTYMGSMVGLWLYHRLDTWYI